MEEWGLTIVCVGVDGLLVVGSTVVLGDRPFGLDCDRDCEDDCESEPEKRKTIIQFYLIILHSLNDSKR